MLDNFLKQKGIPIVKIKYKILQNYTNVEIYQCCTNTINTKF